MKTEHREYSDKEIKQFMDELSAYENAQHELELKKLSEYDKWEENVGECRYWFNGVCKHEFYGENVCKGCVKYTEDGERLF